MAAITGSIIGSIQMIDKNRKPASASQSWAMSRVWKNIRACHLDVQSRIQQSWSETKALAVTDGRKRNSMMRRSNAFFTLSLGLVAGCVLGAAPNYAALKNNQTTHVAELGQPPPQMLAQAEQPGLEVREQQLLNQIQADNAQLRADEAAERAQQLSVNPQRRWIRASLIHLNNAAGELRNTTAHYSGHRAEALTAMAEAHNQLMQCYRIDSRQR
jgi:hypothetical protein